MATREALPPPPSPPSDASGVLPWVGLVARWLEKVWRRVDAALQIAWSQVDTTGSKLSDLDTRTHDELQALGLADPAGTDDVLPRHTTDARAKANKDHRDATSAHGASGDVVGTGDAATTLVAGVVLQAASVADLNQTISNPPTQAEVQAISDKVDALLAAMRTATQLKP